MTLPATGEAIVPVIAIVIVVFAFLIAGIMRPWRFRREVESRPDHSPRWRSEFPSDMPTVDRMLTIFCEAFMFDEHHKYKFVPEDGVAIIYKNTTGPIGDEFQYEELIMGIEETFEIDLTECNWDESLTLGDLVRTVLESKERDRHGAGI
jgi:hypothetical protein